MGIEDRDWYREATRKKGSRTRVDPHIDGKPDLGELLDRHAASERRASMGTYLLWGAFIGALAAGVKVWNTQGPEAIMSRIASFMPKPVSLPDMAFVSSAPPCVPTSLPDNGAIRIETPSVMNRSDIPFAVLRIKNQLSTPLLATLLVSAGQPSRLASMIVHANSTSDMSAPVGSYRLELSMGSQWCGNGFVSPKVIGVNGGIPITAMETSELAVAPGTEQGEKLRLTLSSRPIPIWNAGAPGAANLAPVPQLSGGGLILNADPLGHYRLSGTVNGRPTRFLLDTGASVTSISRRLANEAGIYQCAYVGTSNTANGRVSACTARVDRLTLESVMLTNAEVQILENLEGDALLGMSTLKLFSMTQYGNQMTLTPMQSVR